MTDRDPRPIDARLEAAFDRYNRAAMAGLEPSPGLFIEALEAEGLSLSIAPAAPADAAKDVETAQPDPSTGSVPVHRSSERLIPRRVRGLF
jgi:hypothetical protein